MNGTQFHWNYAFMDATCAPPKQDFQMKLFFICTPKKNLTLSRIIRYVIFHHMFKYDFYILENKEQQVN